MNGERSGLAGLAAELSFVVTAADTAVALGSGEVEVLATPRLIAWLEAATVAAVAGALPADQTTVGIAVDVVHVAASRIGSAVIVRARVAQVRDRRLDFAVTATAGTGTELMRGTIGRVQVPRSRYAD